MALELRLQESRVKEAAAAYQSAEAQVAASQERILELTSELTALRDSLSVRLATFYQLGSHGYLRLFLAVEPGSDPLAVLRQLRFLLYRDIVAVAEYRDVRRDLELERLAVEEVRQEAQRWLRAEDERRMEVDRLHQRQDRLLSRLMKERQSIESRAAELVDKENRLASLIAFLYAQSASVPSQEGTPIQRFRGVLDWPIQGPVAAGFGPRKDPRYQTEVPHNGIEIVTEEGSDVRVVFPGKVLFAAPFEGYGFTAVVQHHDRVFTLYAGLSALHVGDKDVLSLGDSVGAAGAALYFEVRVKNLPEDPLLWLR